MSSNSVFQVEHQQYLLNVVLMLVRAQKVVVVVALLAVQQSTTCVQHNVDLVR